LICRSLSGTTRLYPNQIKDIQIAVTGSSSAITINLAPRGSRTILLKSFEDSTALAAEMSKWKEKFFVLAKPNLTGRKFTMRGVGWLLIAVSIFMIVIALVSGVGDSYRLFNQIALIVLSVLFIILGVLGMKSNVMVTESGIESLRFGKLRKVLWSDIKSVKLTCVRSSSTTIESIRIETGAKPIILGQGYDDFPLLRDAILAKVDPLKVKDERPGPT
jgi:uncharacterized membrane protein